MDKNKELRQQLVNLLMVRQAHTDFEGAVTNFPEEHINSMPANCKHSFWHVLEHLYICQKDILDYIVSDSYKWPKFPDDFWPNKSAKTNFAGWEKTIEQFLADRQKLVDIINNPNVDLFKPLPNSGKHQHTILREVNIVASHNSYHTGGLIMMRQSVGLWL